MNWRELREKKVSVVGGAITRWLREKKAHRVKPILFGLLLAVTALVGCSDIDSSACPDGMEEFVNYQLFMGRSISDGTTVTDADWETFLEEVVTPRFPDGLTVLDAAGQWRGSDGVIQKEQSKLLMILAPPGEDAIRSMDEISEEYKGRFNQESVLRVVEDACVSF